MTIDHSDSHAIATDPVAGIGAVLAAFSGANEPGDWLNRLRLNFQVGLKAY
jgi:hypothetical protein